MVREHICKTEPSKQNISQQYALVETKDNHILGCIVKTVISKWRKVNILLHSADLRPYLQCCV